MNRIYPPSLGVPWPTSFPGCIQSKYWAEAEEAARQFAQEEIGIFSARYKKRDEVIEAVVDAAVSFAVNVVPTGDLGRMRTVARVYVGVFVHDGEWDSDLGLVWVCLLLSFSIDGLYTIDAVESGNVCNMH